MYLVLAGDCPGRETARLAGSWLRKLPVPALMRKPR